MTTIRKEEDIPERCKVCDCSKYDEDDEDLGLICDCGYDADGALMDDIDDHDLEQRLKICPIPDYASIKINGDGISLDLITKRGLNECGWAEHDPDEIHSLLNKLNGHVVEIGISN
jgi:hypothetical protein